MGCQACWRARYLCLGVPDLQEPVVVSLLHLLGLRLHDALLHWLEEGHACLGHPKGSHQKGGDHRLCNRHCDGIGVHLFPIVCYAYLSICWVRDKHPERWPCWGLRCRRRQVVISESNFLDMAIHV